MNVLIYTTIFFLSFIILSLQVILGVIFNALAFPPFFTISFSLLGLTLAGVFVYLKYANKNNFSFQSDILLYMYILGLLLVFYTFFLRNFSLIPFIDNTNTVSQAYWNRLLIKTIGSSLGIGVVFTLVFFSLGIIYSLIYKHHSQQGGKVYFFDLAGAALGCVFGTVILNCLQPSSVLILLSLSIFCLTCFYEYRFRRHVAIKALVCMLACFVLLAINIKTDFFEIRVKDYHTYWTKAMPFYQETWHRWNAYSRTALLRNLQTKYSPGQSIEYTFSILDGRARVVPFDIDDPYSLQPEKGFIFGFTSSKDVLILMAGAGSEMVEMYSFSKGKSDITGVELNQLIISKARTIAGYNLDAFFKLPNVHMVNQEGRSYIESTKKKFDLIVLSWSGSTGMQCLGVNSFTPQYLYTKEAFKSYLKRLNYGGKIIVVDRNKIKVLAMAKAAFEELGIGGIAHKVILLGDKFDVISGACQKQIKDSQDGIGLIIKSSNFTKNEVDDIQRQLLFASREIIYSPYFTHKDFQVFENLLKSNNIYAFVKDLSVKLGRNFIIPSDDAPFINIMDQRGNFFWVRRWAKFLNESSTWSNREAIYSDFMIYLLHFLVVLGFILIVIPLVIRAKKDAVMKDLKTLVYFAILGLGFIFVEIAILHVFVLLMGNPIYSFAVVLAGLLLSTGVGSWLSGRFFVRHRISIKRLSLCAAILLCCYYVFVSILNRYFLGIPLWPKFLMTIMFIFPLGVILGVFFPQGLRIIGHKNSNLIPIAWGINDYMSIVGSLLCINLSRAWGFSIFLLFAAFLYFMIIFFSPKAS